MHPELATRFSRLGTLYRKSKTTAADNYFAIYDSPTLRPSTQRQFETWEALLQRLDPDSFQIFVRKTAGRVSGRLKSPDRGWSQLVEAFNEVRGYSYVQGLGYLEAKLLDEKSAPFPDIEASKMTAEKCLMEVKTIQESDEEIEMRGKVQSAQYGLPTRLERAIRNKYSKAIEQLNGHQWASEARRICYLVINLDLATALAQENKKLLEDFISDLESASAEIHCHSQYWSPEPD
jgi:hypothetical protein